jgi:hypothetical protein
LFLGNSITLHGPKADIGWMGNWGMAASVQEKDYVHRLLQRFAAAAGGAMPDARIENIAAFERGYGIGDFAATFQAFADFQAEIIILAIGENVPALTTPTDQDAFRAAVAALLALLTQHRHPTLVVRSTFWPDPVKDAILRQVCADADGTFVDISHLGVDERNYARTESAFTDAGVAAHPGDAGMAAIAEVIWQALEGRLPW